MSDRPDQPPTDVAYDNIDQPTNHDPGDSATDQPTTDPQPIPMDDAAAALGITVNAVRQRLKRGTLRGHKTPAGWVVFLPTDQSTSSGHDQPATDRPQAHGRPPTNRPTDQVGIAPLADLIADLTRENRELAAAAALWQERSRYLSERLQALEAGPIAAPAATTTNQPAATTHDTGAQEAQIVPKPTPATSRSWWKRLFGVG